MKKAVGAVVPFVMLLAAACLGNSAAGAPSASTVPTHAASAAERQVLSIGPHPVVDARTRDRLLRRLASALRGANPAIPVIPLTGGSVPASSARDVFVVPTVSVHRLDIATIAADGGYVHLIAVDRRAPRFTFGSLLRGGL